MRTPPLLFAVALALPIAVLMGCSTSDDPAGGGTDSTTIGEDSESGASTNGSASSGATTGGTSSGSATGDASSGSGSDTDPSTSGNATSDDATSDDATTDDTNSGDTTDGATTGDGEPEALPEIRFLSFNVKAGGSGTKAWSFRKKLIAEVLRRQGTEIVGIQEDSLNYVQTLIAEMGPETPFGFTGAGLKDGMNKGRFNAILYRSDRFEVDAEEHGTFWLSETPDEVNTQGHRI